MVAVIGGDTCGYLVYVCSLVVVSEMLALIRGKPAGVDTASEPSRRRLEGS